MAYHDRPAGEVLAELETDAQHGLTAEQVAARRAQYGENKLDERKKKPLVVRFFEQFKDVMIIILLIAACVSFGVICYQVVEGKENPIEFVEQIGRASCRERV